MKRSDITLTTATDEQLLYELICRNKIEPAPTETKWYGKAKELTVGIGADNTASIYLHNDDLKALREKCFYGCAANCDFPHTDVPAIFRPSHYDAKRGEHLACEEPCVICETEKNG